MTGSDRKIAEAQQDEDAMSKIHEALAPLGYHFAQKLGEGSYANVYLVKWQSPHGVIPMACKILKAEKVTRDERSLNYITRELFIHLNAYHPDIIHTYSVFQINHHFMIFMSCLVVLAPDYQKVVTTGARKVPTDTAIHCRNAEYNNVTNFLMKHGSVKERVARFWIRQTASALFYLHELDLIHRDLKCDNLLISVNHNVKLTDFGFARFTIDLAGKPTKCLTACGSIPYCAPEVFKGQPYDGKPTDIWGLGCILFVMLNKKLPFKHSNNYTKMYQEQMKGNYIWSEEIKETVTEECVEVMGKLLDPNPKTRITAEEFLDNRWIKMDPTLVKGTKAQADAIEQAYIRRSDIKPYKTPKFTLDTKNELKIWSHDNQQWTSTKDLLKVQVNSEAPAENSIVRAFKNLTDKALTRQELSDHKRAISKITELGDKIKAGLSEMAQRSRQQRA